MRNVGIWRRGRIEERIILAPNDFKKLARRLCEKALGDAKSQLHPLVQSSALDHLDRRSEFLETFKSALEHGVAGQVSIWQPGIQAVFKYEETLSEPLEVWQGPIHLLVKLPRLSNAVKAFGKRLDKCLVYSLRQLDWQRFQTCQSILDIQQVTPNELRHSIGYGAMFCAVYNMPVKVWPPAA